MESALLGVRGKNSLYRRPANGMGQEELILEGDLLALLPPQLHKLIPPGAAALAALHDVGKVSPGFQVKSEAWLVQHSLRDRALKEGWGVH
jgi:hypothetical protein